MFSVTEVKIIPTLIPAEQKAENIPPKEAKQAIAVGSSVALAAVGVIALIFILDFPSLIA